MGLPFLFISSIYLVKMVTEKRVQIFQHCINTVAVDRVLSRANLKFTFHLHLLLTKITSNLPSVFCLIPCESSLKQNNAVPREKTPVPLLCYSLNVKMSSSHKTATRTHLLSSSCCLQPSCLLPWIFRAATIKEADCLWNPLKF